MFPGITFKVVGEPKDIGAAHQLASEDRYQFQWWALSLVRARPLGGDAGSRMIHRHTLKNMLFSARVI